MTRTCAAFLSHRGPARGGPFLAPGRTIWQTLRASVTILILALGVNLCPATLLWSDLGATQVHETGPGPDILGGVLRRDDSASDVLYFKVHVEPLSDASTEEYFAAFQLFEGQQERLAVGNALRAWAYSAFPAVVPGTTNRVEDYIDLKSSKPERSGAGTFYTYELPYWGIERTIVFKVQYVPGEDDLVTVWLDPDLQPGATESGQPEQLIARFKANASFDQIHLRHGGGGDGWIFSEMAVATAFDDFVNANRAGPAGIIPGLRQEQMPFTFRSWEREQGLPQNFVRALAQTRDGYLWVGSDDGVSRFDGVNFLSFGSTEGFQSGPVQALYGDSRGGLWIGSVGGGLGFWQGGKLKTITTREGLPSDSVTALAADREGRLWVGTKSGLAIWHEGRAVTVSGLTQFEGKNITTLFCDREGTMWLGASETGVFSFKGGQFTQLREAALDSLLQDPHCVLVDQAGRIWIGAGDAMVLCREGNEWRRYGVPRHLLRRYISTLAEAPDGTVWAGSVGEGLFQFRGGKLEAINASSGLSDNLVEALLVDREGRLWVGTHGGLNRLLPKKLIALSHNQGLGYGAVQGLAEVSPGVIWASKANEGVFRWDGQRFSRLVLPGISAQEPRINALLAARDGSAWLAGAFGLLQFTNPANAEAGGGIAALNNLPVSVLTESSTGILWAGTREGELWRFANGTWQALTNSPHGFVISAIIPDSGNGLWVGTEGDGLFRFEGERLSRRQRITGLPSGWIRTLHLDAQNTLWIGSAGGGLSRLRGDKISTVTTREGLPDNTISQILEDGAAHLWLGGNRGIVRVNKKDLDDLAAQKISVIYPQFFGRAEGMLSEECTGGYFSSGLKPRSGLLWFSTLKGIVVVDPQHISVSAPAPAVVLEQTLVNGVSGEEFRISGRLREIEGKTVNGSPSVTSSFLRLPPDKHRIEFRYTGLSFDAPERIRFRYRLEGLDPDWVDAGTRRSAFYGFVPPGTYRFRVIACNADGIWNEVGDGLAVEVLRHFWQTWWFIGAVVLGTIVVGAGTTRIVEKRKSQRRLKRLEQERMLEQERTRIAQDLHDIMGAKLCRISFLSEHTRRNETVSSEVREQISAISDDSREVLQSLDEIVWAVNPQNDSLEHLVSYIAQYAREYFRRTGIECELLIPGKIPPQPLSAQSRHHLFLSVDESLTNILKHSKATKVKIEMACRGPEFEIAITDNGVGIDPNSERLATAPSSAGFGNGLRNMRQRVAQLGGRCLVESQPGKGTTIRFVLSFPNAV
jgi:ligand-binding sensor domain-containing protein/signal transduction histidine kinase